MPTPLESNWVTNLKAFNIGEKNARQQASDLTRYFDTAFFLHNQYPADSVLQFAIARLRSIDIYTANWEIFQKLLLLCVIPEPATFPYVLEQIITRTNKGATPMRAEIEEVVNALVCEHSSQRHSSEVANAVWSCLALDIKLHTDATAKLSTCNDPVVSLLTLHCESEHLLNGTLDKSLWMNHMTAEGLYDENWLLAYEANIKGWLPNAGTCDHVVNDPNFSFLKTQGVSFYNSSLAKPPAAAPVPLPILMPISTYVQGSSM